MENRLSPESLLEKFGTGMDSLRRLAASAWQLGFLMTKGAYLVSERRRLFTKLGEEVFDLHQKGEFQLGEKTDQQSGASLTTIVHQLERLTKKVELEEMLIRNLRFHSGKRRAAPEKTT